MKQLVIFGTGSLARLAFIHFMSEGRHEVAAFTVTRNYLDQPRVLDRDVVAYEEIERTHPPDAFSMFVAIGYRRLNQERQRVYEECRHKGYELASCASLPAAIKSYVKIGDNCLIMPNATVQPFAEVGNGVVIWGGSCIGFESHIGDHCYVAPGAVIAGNVRIGERCFVGANATIKDGLTIAPECVIGAGAIILRDTERGKVYRGRSAELLAHSSSDQRYFK